MIPPEFRTVVVPPGDPRAGTIELGCRFVETADPNYLLREHNPMTFEQLVDWYVSQAPASFADESAMEGYRKAVSESLKGLGYGEQIATPDDMSQWRPEKQIVNDGVQQ